MTFLKRVGEYVSDAFKAAKYIGQGMGVVFDHMNRRPVTVQYPFEKLIPSERFRGRIHFEFDKCIACEICVRVCPIDLPVVDWVYNTELKEKRALQLQHRFWSVHFLRQLRRVLPHQLPLGYRRL
jgi:NAD(P)H-quinone oxidoreductase subunit I